MNAPRYPAHNRAHNAPTPPRPSIGVHFLCANQYLRVYRSADASHYLARCPKCAKSIRFRVEPGGTNQRFFEISC